MPTSPVLSLIASKAKTLFCIPTHQLQNMTQKRVTHRLSWLAAAPLLSLLSLAAVASTTVGGFVAVRPIPVLGSPYSTASADFNHDGIPDLLVAAGKSTTRDASGNPQETVQGIAVLIGKGDGSFLPAVHYATTDSASFVAVADVNSDGNPDAIAVDMDMYRTVGSGAINIFLGNGDGTFKPAVSYSIPGAWATSVFPADVNGDGRVDLVVSIMNRATPMSSGFAILLNDGAGTFHLGQQVYMGNPAFVGVADLNHDGRMDLVVAVEVFSMAEFPDLTLYIYAGAGNGTFSRLGPSYPLGNAGTQASVTFAIADYNEDGNPDVALVDGSPKLKMLLGNGAGGFTLKPMTVTLDSSPTAMAAGDFNHDGHQDLAVGTAAGVDVILGRGDATFSYRAIYGTDMSGGPFTTVDLNGDGYLDLVLTNSSGTVNALMGKPGGTFNAMTIYALGPNTHSDTLTADFNGDGIPDVAVLNYVWRCYPCVGGVSILLGKGNGQFQPLAATFGTGTVAAAFAAGDVNGDGKIDLLIESDPQGDPAFTLLLGNGDGTFQAPQSITNICYAQGKPYLADLNDDGKLDVVSYCGVALGNGDGTFKDSIPFSFGMTHVFALGDFNRDGKLDVAAVRWFEQTSVSIFLGKGDGQFNAQPSSTRSIGYGDLAVIKVGHFTSDGNLGVVAGVGEQYISGNRLPYGAFSIFTGMGDGTLRPPVTYQLTQNLADFGVADFNGDGIDDVAVLNAGSDDDTRATGSYALLSLYSNLGDGTLRSPVQFGANGMTALAAADFNNDGAVDLVGGPGVMLNTNGTKVVLTSSTGTAMVGQDISFQVSVVASFRFSGAMSGTVKLYDNGALIGSAKLVGGLATIHNSSLAAGTHTISAAYLGSPNYNPHTSNAIMEVIQP